MAAPAIDAFDEMQDEVGIRAAYRGVYDWLAKTPPESLERLAREAELLFRRLGITFAVYGEGGDPDRLIPFDVVPRVIAAAEWRGLVVGLEQRVRALNAFLADVYGGREILRAGVIPESILRDHPSYCEAAVGIVPPGGIHTHISGIDVVRVGPADFYVLEDNCRTPSGVSYMLENREAMLRLMPGLFETHPIAPVSRYPEELFETLRSVAPAGVADPTVVVLTPGPFNSAYYEHAFLADEMGVELVEAPDLYVDADCLMMRTTRGPRRVDVVYRRVDDEFLDPDVFRPDSVLGVRGLYGVYRAGRVALANALGNGIADDKGIYPYVPEMIRFYLGEEPRIGNVPTWRCAEPDSLAYVLDHLPELVVKESRGSGGYGMLIGPTSTKAQIEAFAARLRSRPDDYIAQPTLALSTCPTFVESGVAPRHVDLRPFVLMGSREVRIVPGGLTRVALRAGSLVVNSSQGGGTKDTWVLET
ncbi:MAG: circularly permuted type 2 ATP-grasp protein [Myxococcota bacterium]